MKQEWFPYDMLTQSLPPLSETSAKVTADMVFSGMYMDSINPNCLFLARFNRVSNLTHVKGINCSKAKPAFKNSLMVQSIPLRREGHWFESSRNEIKSRLQTGSSHNNEKQ